MPSGSYKAKADAECPFYAYDDSTLKKIVCEGIKPDSTLTQTFKRKSGYSDQLSQICCRDYKDCELYRILMAIKYSDY